MIVPTVISTGIAISLIIGLVQLHLHHRHHHHRLPLLTLLLILLYVLEDLNIPQDRN